MVFGVDEARWQLLGVVRDQYKLDVLIFYSCLFAVHFFTSLARDVAVE